MEHETRPDRLRRMNNGNLLALGISVGIALGAGMGVALQNIGLGVGCGVALGAAIGSLWERRERASREGRERRIFDRRHSGG